MKFSQRIAVAVDVLLNGENAYRENSCQTKTNEVVLGDGDKLLLVTANYIPKDQTETLKKHFEDAISNNAKVIIGPPGITATVIKRTGGCK